MDEAPVVVVAAVVAGDAGILVTRRKAGSHLALQWEFPGGKLEWGESPEHGLARELEEELGVEIAVGRVLDVVFYRYPDRDVLLLFYACHIVSGEPKPLDSAELRWVARGELTSLEWVPADRRLVRKLARPGTT